LRKGRGQPELIAFWAIVTGVLEIVAGIRLREVIANELLLILMGVISVLFGILIIVFPGAGALAIVIWIGAYALVFGIILIALAFRLRSFRQLDRFDAPILFFNADHFRRRLTQIIDAAHSPLHTVIIDMESSQL
jgi:hypothetical protein